MWKFSSHRRFHEMLNDVEVIPDEFESEPDLPYFHHEVDTAQNIIEVPNSLDFGIELDMDNDIGYVLDPSEEDWDVDAELQDLSKNQHTYCNIEMCKVHGSYFKAEFIR